MEAGINLLPEVTEKEIKAGVYQKKINLVALGALAVLGVIILALIGYRIYLSATADSISKKTAQVERDIRKNIDVEVSYTSLQQKLNKTMQILTNEIPTSTLIEQVSQAAQTSQPVAIQGLTAQSDGSVVVDGTAANSTVFGQWVDNLTNTNGKDYFAKINAISLNGTPSGYVFSFRLNFLKKGVYQPK